MDAALHYAVAAYQSEAGDVPGNTLRTAVTTPSCNAAFTAMGSWLARYEHASGSGEQSGQPRSADWQRNDRTRISPLLTRATHFFAPSIAIQP